MIKNKRFLSFIFTVFILYKLKTMFTCTRCGQVEELQVCPSSLSELFNNEVVENVESEGFLAASELKFCSRNPFVGFLKDEKNGKVNELYLESERYVEKFFRMNYMALGCVLRYSVGHRRYEIFNEKIDCPSLQRYPNIKEDGYKQLCEISKLKSPCVIYSLGSNNNYLFEDAILKDTPCEIHTFDCTVNPSSEKNPKINFHKVCLGSKNEVKYGNKFQTLSTITSELGHDRIDLLKMDIEGFETSVFRNWLPTDTNLPYQIVVELHLWAIQPPEALLLLNQLYHLGYRVIKRDDNPIDPACSEITLIRVKCPESN